jgi:4-hydroxy-tetrahydrodipicolinate reductase
MINIAVAGAAGRMGRRISALCIADDELTLSGAFEPEGNPALGQDIATLAGLSPIGVKVTAGIESVLDSADVIIDFTAPAATVANLNLASEAGKAYVTGTTGLTKDDIAKITVFASKTPCVMASNMSLGVNLLMKVLKDVAGALGDDYDVEIIEAHHKLKKDAPSGTAFMFAQSIAEGLDRDLDAHATYARHGIIGERKDKEIGIQTIRGGDIVGEHTAMFIGMGERIEVSHKISDRDTFARGALRAAKWLAGKSAGLYDMQDVLGLK